MVNDVDSDAMQEERVRKRENPFYGRPKEADKVLGRRKREK